MIEMAQLTPLSLAVDICLDHGINMFGVATSYGSGHSESFVGDAIKGRLDKFILSTKAEMPSGPGPLQVGLSR
jgi:aryl-alcohol dehydrogenase-like predicted oxidoreductase